MQYYFCLIPYDACKNGVNVGATYAYKNRSSWVKGPNGVSDYLASGYVKGVDHVRHNGKTYAVTKSIVDLTEGFVVLLCTESIAGCDVA